jgi:phospholipid/cholesterol/gamma-HCH transport system substrate-binding protein
VRALDNLDRFAKILAEQKTTIAQALTDIAPGLKILADQEPDLTKLLSALSTLGVTATRVINETKANTVADLASLVPALQRLAQAGTYLPRALEVLLDYPFPRNATNGIFGDYTGLLADIDLNASVSNLASMTGMGLPMAPAQSGKAAAPHAKSTTPLGKTPALPTLPNVPTLPALTTSPDSSVLPSLGITGASAEQTLAMLLLGGLQ